MTLKGLLGCLVVVAFATNSLCEDNEKDFDFNDGRDSDEVMIAQESRHYQTFVKPPVRIVKPSGVTNSHRPQYNLDSYEEGLGDIKEYFETTTRRTVAYKPSYKLRSKESMIKDAVLRALERKDHVGKFAQILPIIRAMSGSQRVALASLVASQVTTPPGGAPLNLAQKNITRTSVETPFNSRGRSALKAAENSSVDLTADASNQTLSQDLPVAEKLRALHRYVDRRGNLIRRGNYPLKPITRRTTAEPTLNPVTRRRPAPPRTLPSPTSSTSEQSKCELFTSSVCLHSDDYPTDAIVQSLRRNKAAAGALLTDFQDPGEGAVDGVTSSQEAKYTADHYLISNRRGDTANRDFAGAGEAGFMCPSTVKYARPQRARATSGQWKYIVNTGEHTQTLRLEKCLKPKESCTYLTDNFKSKCVQVYNYHRLLTWDQQNGLHMDIFKVPTCCSCHIEGYSVSFPPLGHRVHETSSEQFPGDDLMPEHGNQAFESVQSTINRPSVSKSPPFVQKKPLENFPPFSDNHNLLNGISHNNAKLNENDEEENNGHFSNPMDSYGNTYFPDSFDQASTMRKIKRPVQTSKMPVASSNYDSVTLPSFLEPPTPAGPDSFTFIKETPNKYKITGTQFKRGPIRPNRRPIRKKISTGPEDLVSSGTSAHESYVNSDMITLEDVNDDLEDVERGSNIDPKIGTRGHVGPSKRVTIVPKLHAVTTEPVSTTFASSQSNFANENLSTNPKRVNYNYHPIIDFFEDNEKERENQSIDREDTEVAYTTNDQSEWKPINNLPSRNEQSVNLTGKKKH